MNTISSSKGNHRDDFRVRSGENNLLKFTHWRNARRLFNHNRKKKCESMKCKPSMMSPAFEASSLASCPLSSSEVTIFGQERGGAGEDILIWSDRDPEDMLCHQSYSKCDHNLLNGHRAVLKKTIQTINSSGNKWRKNSAHFLMSFYTTGPFFFF